MKKLTKFMSLLLAVAMVLTMVACHGTTDPSTSTSGSNDSSKPTPSVTDGKSDYVIKVQTAGGMPMEKIDLEIYNDSNLVDIGATGADGSYTVKLAANKEYSVKLTRIPAGYEVQESYSFTGNSCVISLESSVITDEKISGWNNPWFRCETEIGDCTSPRDMITMLRALHDGTLLGREASDRMLALMKPNPARARIGKYLPVGVPVCRKTGTLHRGLCNDTGIVYTPKGDYALMIFYNGNLGTPEEYDSPLLNVRCDELLARISKAVWEIVNEE